jgi:uncharacterized protein YciI
MRGKALAFQFALDSLGEAMPRPGRGRRSLRASNATGRKDPASPHIKWHSRVCFPVRFLTGAIVANLHRAYALIIACSLIAALTLAQEKKEPQSKLVQFQMALLKRGPKWTGAQTPETQHILHQHLVNVLALLDSGKAVIAGPFGDDTDLAGIFILRASPEEAKTWVAADPVVKAGLFVAEMHPWWSEDIFKKRDLPSKFTTLYLAFLKKGPNRKEGDDKTPQVEELQKAHLANIKRLADTKQLIAAGPFGDDGDLRGIFVFRVGSLEEAQELCATDPMIKAGRLAVELHPWQVPEGILP